MFSTFLRVSANFLGLLVIGQFYDYVFDVLGAMPSLGCVKLLFADLLVLVTIPFLVPILKL
jgi:hypothetical protein